MKKFLSSICLFVYPCFFAYCVFVCLWGHFVPQFLTPNLTYKIGFYGFMNTRLNEVTRFSDVDILFLGSSHAYRGFDTRIYEREGVKAFNFGSSAQSPIQTKMLLERYLGLLNPKLIVLEVSPLYFSIDGVESSLDLIANTKQMDMTTFKMAAKVRHIKTFNCLIYGIYREGGLRNNEFVEGPRKGDNTYVSGGFVEKKLSYYKPEEQPELDVSFKEYQVEAFEEALAIIKEKGIDFVLVQAPITKSLAKSFINNDSFDDKMTEYGRYYNFNNIIQLNDSIHFYDKHHLNQIGVKIFNDKLIELITQ